MIKTGGINDKKISKIIKSFNSSGIVHKKKNILSIKKKSLSSSSKQWVLRQMNDVYVAEVKRLNYRARSALKLIEINTKFDLLNRASVYLKSLSISTSKSLEQKFHNDKKDFNNHIKVLDLGCAPGSWSQVVTRHGKKIQTIVGVDLLPMEAVEDVHFIQGNFCDSTIQEQIFNISSTFDIILSDIAPNTTGNKNVDHIRILSIIESQVEFASKFLSQGGCFISKMFQGGAEKDILCKLRSMFQVVKHFKPKASRKESNEIYIICLNFL